ncbi:MAG: cellulase family glycosylhydrolase, partial [Isosphaeraceae bacterium]
MRTWQRLRRRSRSTCPSLEAMEDRLLLTARPPYNTGTGFFVIGNQIYDANGNPFIMKGVNLTQSWMGPMNGFNALPEVAKSGANAVRMVFATYDNVATDPVARGNAVREAIANGLVPVVEEHSVGLSQDPSAIDHVVDIWLQPGNVEWLKKYERYVILNIANEWGPETEVWATAYESAVQRIREAGINCAIMVDSGLGGQSADTILNYATRVQQSDPQHNVIFSIHMYWYWVTEERPWLVGVWGGGVPWDVRTELTDAVNLGIPLVIGEFAWQGPNYSAAGYDTRLAMQAFDDLGIGWLAWGWYASGGHDMLVSDKYADYFYDSDHDLWVGGQFLVNDPTLGLKQTATPATIFAQPPPKLAEIPDQTAPLGSQLAIPLKASVLSTTVTASPPFTYSVSARTLTGWLDETYNLSVDPAGFHTNARGMREKYLRGTSSASFYLPYRPTGYWYYLLPNGDLNMSLDQDLNGPVDGVFIAHVGKAVYDDPTLLTQPANGPVPASVTISGNVVTILAEPGATGTFVVKATVTAGQQFDSRTFRVTAGARPAPPLLSPIENQSILAGESATVALNAARGTGPFIYGAEARTLADWLHQSLQFLVDPTAYDFNARGQGEKYLQAAVSSRGYPGPGPFDYYLLPNGDLYEAAPPLAGATTLNGTLVAHLGLAFYEDPTRLTSQGGTPVPVTLTLVGNSLRILPDPGFVGSFMVLGSLSDGLSTDVAPILVNVTAQVVDPPTLDPIGDKTILSQIGSQLSIDLAGHTSDPSRTLTYSATAEPLLPWLKRTHGLFGILAGNSFNLRGAREKYIGGLVSTRDDTAKVSYHYLYYVLPNGDFYQELSPYVGPLRGVKIANVGSAAYHDLSLITAAPAQSLPVAANLSISGNTLVIDTSAPVGTTFVVTATVSDGLGTASRAFPVRVLAAPNSAPTLDVIDDQTIDSSVTHFKTLTLPGSDPDAGQSLTYSATAETQEYWLKNTYGFYKDVGGYFENAKGQGEKYLRGSVRPVGGVSDPWYHLLPNGELHRSSAPDSPSPVADDLVATLAIG